MPETTTPVQRNLGHGIYGRLLLRGYDAYVLGFNNRFVWRCPTPRLLAMFAAGVSDNHLDIGVGTGYYLDNVRFPSSSPEAPSSPRIGLFDRNANSLAHAARRLRRYRPEVYRGDILRPIADQPAAVPARPFDSISMCYLLHCLPGPMASRAAALDNAHSMLNPGGLIFGATVLGRGVSNPPLTRLSLAFWTHIGVLSNAEDRVEDLRDLLTARFEEVEIELRASVAIFRARKPA